MNNGCTSKLLDLDLVENEIVKMIDNNQNVKRYCKYLSAMPLAKRAIVNGVVINQPDITESLINKNIIPFLYDEKLLDVSKVLVFIATMSGDLKMLSSINSISCNIILPYDYESLENYGHKRSKKLAYEIIDTIDGKLIDNRYKLEVGRYTYTKLNTEKSDYILFNFIIAFKSISTRIGVE